MRDWKKRNPAVGLPAASPVNLPELRTAVLRDQSINSTQRRDVLSWLEDPVTLQNLRNGSLGALLTISIAKFLKLKPRTQLLLSLAGFGIGKMLNDVKSDPRKSSSFNQQLRMYEINNE